MPERPSTFPKRVAAWLFGGTVFGLVVALGIWASTKLEIPLQTHALTSAEGSGRPALRVRDSSTRTSLQAREAKEGRDADLEDEEAQHRTAAAPRAVSSRRSSNTETKESQDDSTLERLERRVAAGMARARESVVTLEYAATDGPADSRRVATGVVINTDGDVLSVRIDRPTGSQPARPGRPATKTTAPAPIVARDAVGRQHIAQWVADDQESGLTLLRISPRTVRPIKLATERPALGNQVVVIGNPFGLGHTVRRGHIAGLDRALKLRSRDIGGLIQVQAPLYPGDSGAVVANFRGQLLGLIRSGLAIPVAANDRVRHRARQRLRLRDHRSRCALGGRSASRPRPCRSCLPRGAVGTFRPTSEPIIGGGAEDDAS